MRSILARLIYNFDVELAGVDDDWLSGQKTYIIWEKGPLKVRFSNVQRPIKTTTG
jgi:hypothetical protein